MPAQLKTYALNGFIVSVAAASWFCLGCEIVEEDEDENEAFNQNVAAAVIINSQLNREAPNPELQATLVVTNEVLGTAAQRVYADASGSSFGSIGPDTTAPYTFKWGDGNMTTGTATQAAYDYPLNGMTYTIMLEVTDLDGNTATASYDFTTQSTTAPEPDPDPDPDPPMNTSPTINAVVSEEVVMFGLEGPESVYRVVVDLSGSSDPDAGDSIDTYSVDWGGGITNSNMTGAQFTHDYPYDDGEKTFTCTVSDTQGGTSERTFTINTSTSPGPTGVSERIELHSPADETILARHP